MSKHTQGPWTWEHDQNVRLDRPALLVKHAGQKMAYVYTPVVPIGPRGGKHCTMATALEGEANARLIAAAPDLLAACRAMVAVHPKCASRIGAPGSKARANQEYKEAAHDAAVAAIAKAEGTA